jgi:long-chain acyl-CoA synthetase
LFDFLHRFTFVSSTHVVWHITERAFELWMASRGCNVVYSSIRTFKKDLAKHQPEWMVLVPRVLEKVAMGVQDKFASGSAAVKVLSKFFTRVGRAHAKHKKIVSGLVVSNEPVSGFDEIVSKVKLALIKPIHAVGNKLVWSKVQEGFGGRIKLIISGGSALAGGLESFYETAGLPVCVGYGLTECSPLISFRRSDRNLVTGGCTGKACLETELRIVDPSAVVTDKPRPALAAGEAGLVLAKGPQVMKGYYKNKEATAKAIDKFGWFDTGDLGRINPATGDLILTGRAKDTIVLSNGENVEPVPIEDAIMGEAPLIDQVMLTGQDGRSLIAVTVLNPLELANGGYLDRQQADALQEASEKVNDPKCSVADCEANCKLLNDAAKQLRSNKELNKAVSDIFKAATTDFRHWEKVSEFYLTLEPFAMANGQLTQSYKVKRAQVMERYAAELAK